jgi:hypothetical protein
MAFSFVAGEPSIQALRAAGGKRDRTAATSGSIAEGGKGATLLTLTSHST